MKTLRLCIFIFSVLSCINSYFDSTALDMDIRIISAKELHSHYLNNEKYTIIDNRPESKYRMGHIPKAINLTYFRDGSPANVLNKETLLEVAKNKTVIFSVFSVDSGRRTNPSLLDLRVLGM